MSKVKCKYPNCQLCEYDYCIREGNQDTNKIKPNRYKVYYEEHKEQKNAYSKEYYTQHKHDGNQYVKWIDVKKSISKLRKEIGTNSFDLIMEEIEKLERRKIVKKKDVITLEVANKIIG